MPTSFLPTHGRTTPEIFGFQVFFVIKINLGSRRAPALQNAMRECFSVADIIRYAAQYIGVVGDDAVYAPGDHIFHVLLVIYRPGVDLHAPAVEQFHQLRLILQKHIPGMHIVGIGALDIMFHVQIGLIIQKAGFNVRAQLLEMLHGDMVKEETNTCSCIWRLQISSITRCSRFS